MNGYLGSSAAVISLNGKRGRALGNTDNAALVSINTIKVSIGYAFISGCDGNALIIGRLGEYANIKIFPIATFNGDLARNHYFF